MSTMNFITVVAGDRVTLRKPHPCGSFDWNIVRTGADIGLKCDRCGRRVMLAREEFERRVKSIHTAAPAATGQPAPTGEAVCGLSALEAATPQGAF